jgi:glycosyltransferase involved in cell wall biosynthesis
MRMSGVGGSENHLRALLPELLHFGWEPDVLIPSPSPTAVQPLADDLARTCGKVTVVRMPLDLSPALILRIARSVRSHDYRLVHSHLVHADWHAAAVAAAARRVPLVSTKHNEDAFRKLRGFRAVERAAENRCAEIIAISESLRRFTLRFTPPRCPVTTVRYGLEVPPRPPQRDSEADNPILLTVARLVQQKGLDVLIRTMPRILEAVPGVQLLIAGEGPERGALELLVRDLRLEGRVMLLGHRNDADELMRRAWVMVHPARWEGFGLVLLEAMRMGLPIVATEVSAIPEIVVDGATGRLVPPDDASALAEAVVTMLDDEAFRRAAAARGFERLAEHFSPVRMARETAEVYERALAASPA